MNSFIKTTTVQWSQYGASASASFGIKVVFKIITSVERRNTDK